MADDAGTYLYTPPDDRLYGRLDAFAPERSILHHMEQVIRKISDEEPGLIREEATAVRFVPAESVPLIHFSRQKETRLERFFCHLKISNDGAITTDW